MAFFKGRETYSVDDKGRVSIPARMRKCMAPGVETFVLTRGLDDDPCIFAYPTDEWRSIEEGLKGLNQFNGQERFFLRMMLSWADEASLDGQSRIMLPKNLVEFARIERSALIVGAMDHIEIWNPEIFDSYLNARAESYEQVAASVMGARTDGMAKG